jgi:hypothetical protein
MSSVAKEVTERGRGELSRPPAFRWSLTDAFFGRFVFK